MQFSTKTKYGISAMILLSESYEQDELKSLVSLAETLDISKIYLEQVFAQLKTNELVVSIKGAKGGYKLSREAKDISVYDILCATESSLFKLDTDYDKKADEAAYEVIYKPFQENLTSFFLKIKLSDLKNKYNDLCALASYMYYV